jgi:hypothetical protein
MDEQTLRKRLERFASKPDEALESAEVSAAFLGFSERTLRYHPDAERVYITPSRYNYRVGNIRQIAKDGFRPECWQSLGDAASRVVESRDDIRAAMRRQQRGLNRGREKGGDS